MRLRRDHAHDGDIEILLQLGQRSRRRRVARIDDELDALALQIGPDLTRELPNLAQRPRPVRQTRVVAEVDKVLVRHGHEALVQDGQAAHARVEHADRPRIHTAIV